MTTSRSHRTLKTRFILYGLGLSVIVATIYIYDAKQEELESLRRCRAEQAALAAQLRAVIDYKERMEHSLAAIRNQHSEALSSLQSQQEEQMRLVKQHAAVQNLYSNLSQECSKTKNTARAEHLLLDACQKQHDELVSHNHELQKKYDEKEQTFYSIEDKVEFLEKENAKLKQKIQDMTEMNQNIINKPENPVFLPHISTSTNNINKNFDRQVKKSQDVYHIESNADHKGFDNESKVRHMSEEKIISNLESKNLTKTTEIHLNSNVKIGDDPKPNIPQGVAPELLVDENLNEKNVNEITKFSNHIASNNAQNDVQDLFNIKDNSNNDENTPNRYELKLIQNGDKLSPNNLNGGNAMDKQIKNMNNLDNFIPQDIVINALKLPNKIKSVNGAVESLNDVDSKFEQDDKEEDVENDVNISQNNGDSAVPNDNRDDDDDYGGPRLEADEEPVNQ